MPPLPFYGGGIKTIQIYHFHTYCLKFVSWWLWKKWKGKEQRRCLSLSFKRGNTRKFERVFSFCRVFSIVVIWNWCRFAVWPISVGQASKWHPYHMITLQNSLQNENTLSQGFHRYPCEFSEDIVTSWPQRFRTINTGVFDVHTTVLGFYATNRASRALE